MKIVDVEASRKYQVLIGNSLLQNAGDYISKIKPTCTIAVISDDKVWPLYGEVVKDSLVTAGYRVVYFRFPNGEASKNDSTYIKILAFLAENNLTRSDLIIALGGGVVGDITGFAAATYLRGVDYIQIPTTLLAMVDSSVGGKTAIDLPQGKNLVGAFYQPRLVLCDIDALDTLAREVFIDGCAEIIKYGILYDPTLFAHLREKGSGFDREYVISRCVELKRDVVAKDEFDNGERQKLNLGHTVGHAVELLSRFETSHGRAVAIGMSIITKAAFKAGICTDGLWEIVDDALQTFSLPTRADLDHNIYNANKLFSVALSDKKRSGGFVNLIIPRKIGDCIIQKTAVKELEAFIESGL